MAIKYKRKSNSAKAVYGATFDDKNVNTIKKDSKIVWEKPIVLQENFGDADLVEYTRVSTNEPSATSGETLEKTTSTYDSTMTVFNEDTIQVSYNNDPSAVTTVDILKINGTQYFSGDILTVDTTKNDKYLVNVITKGIPVTLQVSTDDGVNYLIVEYIDMNGQSRTSYFEESSQGIITNIWGDSTVSYTIRYKSGHILKNNSLHANTSSKSFTISQDSALTITTTTRPVKISLSITDVDEVENVTVNYIDNDGKAQTAVMTSDGVVSDNVKYASPYSYVIKPKADSDAEFIILEDYDVADNNSNMIRVRVRYDSVKVGVNWDNINSSIRALRIRTKSANSNGSRTNWLYRNSPWGFIETVRKGSIAKIISYEFTKVGCYVDENSDKNIIELEASSEVNYFNQLTEVQMDTNAKDNDTTVKVPSGYDRVEVTYINTSGEQVTVTFKKDSVITDMASGSYFEWKAYLSDGRYIADWYERGDLVNPPAVGTLGSPSNPKPPTVIDKPVFRTVNITLNDNIEHIHVYYRGINNTTDKYLTHYSETVSANNRNVQINALVGYQLSWHTCTGEGFIVTPDHERLYVVESDVPIEIAPIATLTYSNIIPVLNEHVKSITVVYKNSPTTTKTITITADNKNTEISDVIVNSNYTWEAEPEEGYILKNSSGSGYVGTSKWEDIIAPEVDPQPYTVSFAGEYVSWPSSYYDVAAGDRLTVKTGNDSPGGWIEIKCQAPNGTYKWDNTATRYQSTEYYTYDGDIYLKEEVPDNMPARDIIIEAMGATQTPVPYLVSIAPVGTGIKHVYLSDSISAITGSSENYYGYGTTVYAFAQITKDNADFYYNIPASWKKVYTGDDVYCYRIGYLSVEPDTVDATINNFNFKDNIELELGPKTWTVTLGGDHINWTKTTYTAMSGDSLEIIDKTLYCKRNGTTIWSATASRPSNTAQYTYTGEPRIICPSAVYGDMTVTADGVTRTTNKYTITLPSAGLGINSVFVSTSYPATAGSASGSKFNYGTTLYVYAKVYTSYATKYTVPAWTLAKTDSGFNYYLIKTIEGKDFVSDYTVTDTVALSHREHTVTFKGTYVNWKDSSGTIVTSIKAWSDDYLSLSGKTLTCKKNDGSGAIRWAITAHPWARTAKYSYLDTNIKLLTPGERVDGSFEYTATGVERVINKYAVTMPSIIGVSSTYLSNSDTATSGLVSGGEFDYDSKVYGYATMATAIVSCYDIPSSWSLATQYQNYNHYIVGTLDKVSDNPSTNVINPEPLGPKLYSVALNTTGDYIEWVSGGQVVTNLNAEAGDTFTIVGTTVTCRTAAGGTRWTASPRKMLDTVKYTYTLSGNITVTTLSNEVYGDAIITAKGTVTRTLNKYEVTIEKGSRVSEVYLSTSPTATTGYASGTTFGYDYTVYGFAKIPTSYIDAYTVPTEWGSPVGTSGNYTCYKVGKLDKVKEVVANNAITNTGNLAVRAHTVTFGGDYIQWKKGSTVVTSQTAYTEDTLTLTGTTLECKTGGAVRWSVSAYRYDDTVQYKYTGNPVCGVTPPSTIMGSITYKATGVNRELQKYAVTMGKGTGVYSTYLSTSSSTTSGTASGGLFDYGSKVYGFAKVSIYNVNKYTVPSTWTKISSSNTSYNYYYTKKYLTKVTENTATNVIDSATLETKAHTITFVGNYIDWKESGTKVTSKTAYADDIIEVNSTSIICKYPSGTQRWKVTAEKYADTVKYKYTGSPLIATPPNIVESPIEISAGNVERSIQKYAVTINKPSMFEGVYLSTSNNATSGFASGATFEYEDTIYGFAQMKTSRTSAYNIPGTWTWIATDSTSGLTTYLVGKIDSVSNDTSKNAITLSELGPKTFKARLLVETKSYIEWKSGGVIVTELETQGGDIITIAGDTVTCKTAIGGTRWTATACKPADTVQYKYTGSVTITALVSEVGGDFDITAKGISRSTQKYKVNFQSEGLGVTDTFSSTTKTATRGNATGYKYNYNSTVYLIAKVLKTNTTKYTVPTAWGAATASDTSYNYYVYATITGLSKETTNSTTAALTVREFTVTLNGLYITWKNGTSVVKTMKAYSGDSFAVDGTSLICKNPSGGARWTVTAYSYADTDQYDYSGTIRLIDPAITSLAADFAYPSSSASASLGITRKAKQYPVSMDSITHTSGIFLSTDPAATSGKASGEKFDYGAVVYGFASIATSIVNCYTIPSTWVRASTANNYNHYRVGQVTVINGTNKITPTETVVAKNYNVSLATEGNYIQWKSGGNVVTAMNAYAGDTISVTGTTATCKTSAGGTRWTATASTYDWTDQYSYSGTVKVYLLGGSVEVFSDAIITAKGTISRSTRKYAVTITKGTGVSEVFLSTTQGATSGSASGTTFNYGAKVYGFAKTSATIEAQYNKPTGQTWTSTGSYCYRVATLNSVSATTANNNLGTISMTPKAWTVTLGGTGIVWKNGTTTVSSMTAYTGDKLSVSGADLICKNGSTTRWTVTASRAANTAQYSYTGTATCSLTPPETVTQSLTYNAQGVTRTLRTYPVTITASTGVSSVYLSTSPTATSGSNSGASFGYGKTVYGFAKITTANYNAYTVPSAWGSPLSSSNTSYKYYKVGSVTVSNGTNNVGTFALTAKAFTVTLKGAYVTWKDGSTTVTSKTAYTGDVLSKSGTSVICKTPAGSTRWTVTANRYADDNTYVYSGTPSPTLPSSTTITSATEVGCSGVTRADKPTQITLVTPTEGGFWNTSSPINALSTDYVQFKGMDLIHQKQSEGGSLDMGSGTSSTSSTYRYSAPSGYKLSAITAVNSAGTMIAGKSSGRSSTLTVYKGVTVTPSLTALPAIPNSPNLYAITWSGNTVSQKIKNSNSFAVTANVTFYNGSGTYLTSKTVSISASSENTVTYTVSATTTSVYTKVYFTASGRKDTSAVTSNTSKRQLLAPIRSSVSTEVNDGYYSANMADYDVIVVIKNPNGVAVTAEAWSECYYAWFDDNDSETCTIPAGGTVTMVVFGDDGDEYGVDFSATGCLDSGDYWRVVAPSSGGQT